MNTLTRDTYEPALLALVEGWLAPGRQTDVLCCGMVGSRQGWVEAPYRPVPCPPSTDAPVSALTTDSRLSVRVLPGLSQAGPHDVMRGEETQIAGFLSLNERWDGVICLPGTHTKWAQVSAGEVVSFQTCMTGELFALLSERSVLRHSVRGDGWDQDAFTDALSDTLSRPESLAVRLFRLRAEHLLAGTGPNRLRAQLSGLLIGAELAAARPYWLGQQVAVIGASAISSAYMTALAQQGVPATQAKATAMTLAGLTAAHRALEHAS
jgi:2-dehydro-3-deoxygalactonokinase